MQVFCTNLIDIGIRTIISEIGMVILNNNLNKNLSFVILTYHYKLPINCISPTAFLAIGDLFTITLNCCCKNADIVHDGLDFFDC